ncbi:MAG: TetR/AcrR family transcriptional regulator [Gammaproteobacteria bacterium]|nr:TetR/AcrR family transcriptional regulator [Gammaproteobacteria bacterium]
MGKRRTAETATIRPTAAPVRGPGRMLPRRSGRPSRITAERLREHILDVATELFLNHGYGSTSIEAVALTGRISKRTFYHRFQDKAALFSAVVHRIIDRLHPPADVPVISGGSLHEILQHLARLMLQGALTPQAVALHRLIVAESARFPELAVIAAEQGGRQEAITLIAGLLEQEARREHFALNNPMFAAGQFLQMVISLPQRRAMQLGTPMTAAEIDAWPRDTVDLFLNGCRGSASRVRRE